MRQKKILVVDDDPNIREAVGATLKDEGHDVITASDGEEGLQKVVTEIPDLIILDVIMPEKHGFQVCRELKADPAYKAFCRIPVLMLTVYPDERQDKRLSMREGMEMEADDYIHKPFDPDELAARVERLLRLSEISLTR